LKRPAHSPSAPSEFGLSGQTFLGIGSSVCFEASDLMSGPGRGGKNAPTRHPDENPTSQVALYPRIARSEMPKGAPREDTRIPRFQALGPPQT